MKRIIDLKPDDVFYYGNKRHIVMIEWIDDNKPLVAKTDFMGYMRELFDNPEQEVEIRIDE